MVRSLRVPGIGKVEVDVQPCEYVKPGMLHVQKISEKFYVAKHRTYEEKTDLQIIAGVKGMESEDRATRQVEFRQRQLKKGEPIDQIIGHIQ